MGLLTQPIFSSNEQEKKTSIQRGAPYSIIITLANHIVSPFKKEHAPHAASQTERLLGALLLDSLRSFPGGLYATYHGFSAYINSNGQLTFPRKTSNETLTVIITKQLYPIIQQGQTVNYFIRRDDTPVAYYTLTRHKDTKVNQYYWETRQIETPTTFAIPHDAIVLHAKPNELYIPEGFSKTIGGQNLLLPLIYPTKELNRSYHALSFLKIKKYFAPVEAQTEIKRSADRYSMLIKP
jgi:hypothetical protein